MDFPSSLHPSLFTTGPLGLSEAPDLSFTSSWRDTLSLSQALPLSPEVGRKPSPAPPCVCPSVKIGWVETGIELLRCAHTHGGAQGLFVSCLSGVGHGHPVADPWDYQLSVWAHTCAVPVLPQIEAPPSAKSLFWVPETPGPLPLLPPGLGKGLCVSPPIPTPILFFLRNSGPILRPHFSLRPLGSWSGSRGPAFPRTSPLSESTPRSVRCHRAGGCPRSARC